ncbi:SOS response-associated peptidase [Acuticoccus sp. M5D2P5]|uniref:SOS response-associated peptidase n=1 Tax=Acuticoccus kalidii TaxID=2910977 RepID=UPI001F18D95F|nr:SOS response-associated peptidase [Acuticoccus kalidii]MCF3936098.1 SOS response-associated peptidase [Acuticoccus kalidii]
MCGRFNLTLPVEALRAVFAVKGEIVPFPPRYNIAPTQPIHVVRESREDRTRTVGLVKWGFLPSWVKDPAAFPLLINARSETAADKPTFRNALRRRRILVPATGFYEWKRSGARKIPYLFETGGPFALAGIEETWIGPNGEELDTAAILTTAATGVPADYHDRMPLTVPEAAWSAWLDPWMEDAPRALALTERAAYTARPVSIRLSNARNEGEGLLTPDPEEPAKAEKPDTAAAPAADDQPSLF